MISQSIYLFGAGVNGFGVLNFLSDKNVEAFIDNDAIRQGKDYYNKPVVSMNDYLNHYKKDDDIIIVTPSESKEIEELLTENELPFVKAPWMLSNFRTPDDIIRFLDIALAKKIELLSESVFDLTLTERLEEIGWEGEIYNKGAGVKGWSRAIVVDGRTFDLEECYSKYIRNADQKLELFKAVHAGKRCFVVGNGPSVRIEDLEKIYDNKDCSFGFNRVYKVFDNTYWRPNYYVAADSVLVHEDRDIIRGLECERFIRRGFDEDIDGCNMFSNLEQLHDGKMHFSKDISLGIYNGFTVVFEAIQIAAYMGFTEIIIIGVDMTSNARSFDENNHFFAHNSNKIDYRKSETIKAREMLGFIAAELEKEGIAVRNATRGGELDEVPRVDFDKCF